MTRIIRMTADGALAFTHLGVYEDTPGKIDGRWLFARRKLYLDAPPTAKTIPA